MELKPQESVVSSSGGWTSKAEALAGLVSPEAAFLGVRWLSSVSSPLVSLRACVPVCVLISRKDTGQTGQTGLRLAHS